MVRGIPEEARGAFAVALTRRLARAEHCTPALLNLTGDLKLTSAEPVLLSHALSDGFWPGDGRDADACWSPDRRAALTGALAKLGCVRLAPVLRRELARRPAVRWWTRIVPESWRLRAFGESSSGDLMADAEAAFHTAALKSLARIASEPASSSIADR